MEASPRPVAEQTALLTLTNLYCKSLLALTLVYRRHISLDRLRNLQPISEARFIVQIFTQRVGGPDNVGHHNMLIGAEAITRQERHLDRLTKIVNMYLYCL